jgi:drug/metabolite transporter (DMT)-like permease
MIIVVPGLGKRLTTFSPRWPELSTHGRAELMLLGAVLVWSLNFSVSKYALGRFSPLAYTAPRYAFAALIFCSIAVRREGSLRVTRPDARLVLAAAAVGIWLNQLAFVYALRLAGAATVSLLFGTAPILVAVFAHVSRIEHVGARTWLATAVSSLGVAVLVIGSGGSLSGSLGGVLLCLVSSATWAAYSCALVPLTRVYSPYRLSAVLTLAGSMPLLASAALQLWGQNWAAIGIAGWLAFAYALLPSYVLSNLVWFRTIGLVGAPRAALYINLEPFLGALFAVLLLSEHVGALEAVGGVVTAGALVLLPRGAGIGKGQASPDAFEPAVDASSVTPAPGAGRAHGELDCL